MYIKAIGANCHGVLVLARVIDLETGKSILYGSQATALTKDLEMTGYALTFWLLGRRYRTYDCYVADEVRQVMKGPQGFKKGKAMLIPFAFRHGNLITARWMRCTIRLRWLRRFWNLWNDGSA